jgi:uncharacterized protein YdiU (UPF0061 family)
LRKSNDAAAIMAQANPQVIPRNHRIEEAIQAGQNGDLAPFHALLAALTKPYTVHDMYSRAPTKDELVTRTFCGT